MKSQKNADYEHLPADLMLKINQLCDRFESELQLGKRPSITTYLNDVPTQYEDVFLKELIPLEIEHQCQNGKVSQASDYLDSFPILDSQWLVNLIQTTQAQNATEPVVTQETHSEDIPLNDYIKQLTESGVFSQQDVTEMIEGFNENEKPLTAVAFSEWLVQSRKLTRYQAQIISDREKHPLQIGDYQILEPIGSGGMGTVYKAVHQRMKRTVALKVIRSDLSHLPDRLKRFEREVQTAARLSHPNVVTAYDAGEDQGIHYLICEYIDGESLTQLVRQSGPLEFPDALNCILQVAHGLEYAHGQGVIHRDIKPANILVDDQGDLKILDMGLARLQESPEDLLGNGSQTQLTSSQFLMGTIDYMAPEQARNTRLADQRSDIYSLGCTFYFLLKAKPVYDGETIVERILSHKEQPIPRLSTLDLKIPKEFDLIFEKILAKDPNDRYQSVTELIGDLDQFHSKFLQDQTLVLPFKEGQTKNPASGNWADSPTVEQPINSGVTVYSSTSIENNQQVKAVRQKQLLWGGVASVTIVFVWAFLWNSSSRDSSSSQSGGFFQSETSLGSQSQQQYAQQMNLPVNDVINLGEAGEPALLEMMLIPPGEFMMGDNSQPQTAQDAPAHRVKITKPFYMGATEITYQQFRRFVDETNYETEAERNGGFGVENGSWRQSTAYSWKYVGELTLEDQTPALSISWNDALAFCKWLSDRTGERFRLPTEAEWEYACRAGTQTAWFFGTDEEALENYAWFANNSLNKIYPVKLKLPNPYGLYDIYGNEWEWCQDYYSATYYNESNVNNPLGPNEGFERVQRGGGFKEPAARLTSYTRGRGAPGSPLHGSFRIVRELKVN